MKAEELKDIARFLNQNILKGKKYAIMGIGSELRSDDAAGMYLIHLLREEIEETDILLIGGSTAPENFTGVIKDFAPDTLFIIDAAHMNLPPGSVKLIHPDNIGGLSFSTHMLPLPVMLNYLQQESNCQISFIGIQPKSTDQGIGLSEEVKTATQQLAEAFITVIK